MPLVLFVAVILTGIVKSSFQDPVLDPFMRLENFSVETWSNDRSDRRRMTADLVTSILPDKTCHEIEALLGPSLDENFASNEGSYNCKPGQVSELRYYIGLDVFWDIQNIRIFFDEEGLYQDFSFYSYD